MNKGLAALCAVFVAVATLLTGKYFWDFGKYPYDSGASTIAPAVDMLYLVISYVTTGMFWLVWALLIGFMVKYRRRPDHKPYYSHGNKMAEIIWTVIPAAMLVGLAIGQLSTWGKAKQDFPTPNKVDEDKDPKTATNKPPVVVQVLAHQFVWNFRYRPEDNQADFQRTIDLEDPKSTYEVKEDVGGKAFFVPVDRKVLITQTSIDVIHSLFIPHMRVKQDAVPGMYIRVWFQPVRFRVADLAESVKQQKPVWKWCDGEEEFVKEYGDTRVAFTGYLEDVVKQEDKEKGTAKFVVLLANTEKKVDVIYKGEILWGVSVDDTAGKPTHAVIPFDVACAELCGSNHHTMKAAMWVGTEKMYLAWLSRRTEYNYDDKGYWKRRWIRKNPAW